MATLAHLPVEVMYVSHYADDLYSLFRKQHDHRTHPFTHRHPLPFRYLSCRSRRYRGLMQEMGGQKKEA